MPRGKLRKARDIFLVSSKIRITIIILQLCQTVRHILVPMLWPVYRLAVYRIRNLNGIYTDLYTLDVVGCPYINYNNNIILPQQFLS